MAGTTESTDPAPANPDEAAPSKSRGEDAKPPAEDVKPPLLFVGRTFHIASTFPEWYDSKLKQDIQKYGGTLTDDLWDSNYIIHNPPSSSEPWFTNFMDDRQAILNRGDPVPVVRSYHWVYSCIHHNPPSILKIDDLPSTQPLLTSYKGEDPAGKTKTQPLSIYCTVNMPVLSEKGEQNNTDALRNVVRSIESNGAYRSMLRKSADILILDLTRESGQRFNMEKAPHQTCYARSWLEGILKGTSPYIRNRPSGKQAGSKQETQAGSSSSHSKAGQQKKKKAEPGSRMRVDMATEGNNGWLEKQPVPVKPSRMEYSEKDDKMIIRWLYYHDPTKGRWKSIKFYQELCSTKDEKYHRFADRHSSQSWHERVRKRYSAFSHRGDKLQSAGLDRLLRTRKERAELQLEEANDEDSATVREWVEGTARADGTEREAERPRQDKGKGREVAVEDQVDGSVERHVQQEAGAVTNGKRKRTRDNDDDVAVENEPARKQPKTTAAISEEPLQATEVPPIAQHPVEREASPAQPVEVPPRDASALQETSDRQMQDDDDVVQETPPEEQRASVPEEHNVEQGDRQPQSDLLQFMQEVVQTVSEVVEPVMVDAQQDDTTRVVEGDDEIEDDDDMVDDFLNHFQRKRPDKGKGKAVDRSLSPQPEVERPPSVQRKNKRISTASEREVQDLINEPEEQTPEPVPPQKATPEVVRNEELPELRTGQQRLRPIASRSRAHELFESMIAEFGCTHKDVLECMKLCARENKGVIGIPELKIILGKRFRR